jgi:hypothetical protein
MKKKKEDPIWHGWGLDDDHHRALHVGCIGLHDEIVKMVGMDRKGLPLLSEPRLAVYIVSKSGRRRVLAYLRPDHARQLMGAIDRIAGVK